MKIHRFMRESVGLIGLLAEHGFNLEQMSCSAYVDEKGLFYWGIRVKQNKKGVVFMVSPLDGLNPEEAHKLWDELVASNRPFEEIYRGAKVLQKETEIVSHLLENGIIPPNAIVLGVTPEKELN